MITKIQDERHLEQWNIYLFINLTDGSDDEVIPNILITLGGIKHFGTQKYLGYCFRQFTQ